MNFCKLLISTNNFSEVYLRQFVKLNKTENIGENDFLVSCLKQELHCTQDEAEQHCQHVMCLQLHARHTLSSALCHRFEALHDHSAALDRNQKYIYILENKEFFNEKVHEVASYMLEKNDGNSFAHLEDIDLLLNHQKPFSEFTDGELDRMHEITCFWMAVCDVNLAIMNQKDLPDDDSSDQSIEPWCEHLLNQQRMRFMAAAAFIVAARHKLSGRDSDLFVRSAVLQVALDTLPRDIGKHDINPYLWILGFIAASFLCGILLMLNGFLNNMLIFCCFIAYLLFIGFCIGSTYDVEVQTQALGYFYSNRFLLKLKLFFRRLFQKRTAGAVQPHSTKESS